MASEENSQWLFTDEELIATPSALQGLQTADEQVRRAKGVNFLVQVGICLKLPQLTIATAAVFFHRYFMRLSMYFEKGGLHHYVCPSLMRVLPIPSKFPLPFGSSPLQELAENFQANR